MAEPVLFREVQRFRQWWFLLLVLGTALVGWMAWVQQIVLGEPFGSDPASDAAVWVVWALMGVAVPAVALSVRLVTTVVPGAVEVGFPPFPPRRVTTDEILDVRVERVRPMARWGGYGYRVRPRGEVAFLVAGRDAVRLSLGEQRTVVIGTQDRERLATAIVEAGRLRP